VTRLVIFADSLFLKYIKLLQEESRPHGRGSTGDRSAHQRPDIVAPTWAWINR
jgi:hypothetical protein